VRQPGPEGSGAGSAVEAVVLDGVTFSYGAAAALRDVTLAIGRGERVAVIGPSGAGKSTLIRVLNTSLLAGPGRARILGTDPAALAPPRLRALRARIGTVWQQLHLVPQASVAENVRMGRVGSASVAALALGGLSAADREAVAAVLGEVGLEHKIDERLDRLSGGEQQRVAVARVLFQAPDVLLADEPLASIDPALGAEVIRLLLQAAHGRTLVVSTHQLDPVLPHFPRVVGLRDGAIAFDAPTADVGADDLARLYQPLASTPSPDRPADPAPRSGPLRLAASTTPGDYLLPRVLPAFRAAHPAERLALAVRDTAVALDDLAAGRVDLALVGARLPRDGFVFEDVATDEIVLVRAAAHGAASAPLLPSALARLPRVDREPGSATRRVAEAHLAALGAPLDASAAVMEAGSVEAQKAAIAGGAGFGFVSLLAVAGDVAAGRLRIVPVARLAIPRRIYAAYRGDAPPTPAARALLDLLRAEAARIAGAP
jgi:phosphonate transport system ATP-binding protein